MRFVIVVLLFFAQAVAGQEPQENTIDLYGKTQEARQKKDFKLFIQLSEKLMARSSGNSSIRYQYARALAANGKSEEALSQLKIIARMGGAPPAAADEEFRSLSENAEFRSILADFEHNRQAAGKSDVACVIHEKKLIPEGIAYDPVAKKYYMGSLYERKILQIDPGGKARDFARSKQDGLWGVLGLEVDAPRRQLWAMTANGGADSPMIDPDPETVGHSAVLKYDLTKAKMIRKYEAGSKEKPALFNDVALAPNGDAYITDSLSGSIYRISATNDRLELFLSGGNLGYPNGIAVSAEGKFLYVSHIEGTTVVNLSTGARALLSGPPDAQLGDLDGLVYYRQSLVGVQSLSGDITRIVRFFLSEEGTTVTRIQVLQANHPAFVIPTTGDLVGDEFHYIANSQIGSFDEKGKIFPDEKLSDPIILKVDLR